MEEVNITVTSSSLKYEGKTSITKAAQVIAFLSARTEGPTNSYTEPQSLEISIPQIAIQKTSPRHMLMESGAKVNAEKIAVLAHYIKKVQGRHSASIQEIKNLFGKAGEPIPKNFARDLKDAVRSNYVFEITDGEYEVTEFGIEAIEKQFSLENVARTKVSQRRTRGATLEIREKIKNVELSSSEDNFPAFHSLNKGQQILWVTCVLEEKYKIDESNMKEICYLIDRLKGAVTTGTFTALNETNIKKGYIKITKEGFKVCQKGLDRIHELRNELMK